MYLKVCSCVCIWAPLRAAMSSYSRLLRELNIIWLILRSYFQGNYFLQNKHCYSDRCHNITNLVRRTQSMKKLNKVKSLWVYSHWLLVTGSSLYIKITRLTYHWLGSCSSPRPSSSFAFSDLVALDFKALHSDWPTDFRFEARARVGEFTENTFPSSTLSAYYMLDLQSDTNTHTHTHTPLSSGENQHCQNLSSKKLRPKEIK